MMDKRVLVISGLNVLLPLAALLLALSRPAKGEPGPMGPMGPKGDMGAPGACDDFEWRGPQEAGEGETE